MIKRLKSYLRTHLFSGAWWTIFINPAFIARRRLFQCISNSIRSLNLNFGEVWLDVGCGSRPYEHLFNIKKYIGMDVEVSGHPLENKKYDILYDGKIFPQNSMTMDGVFCTQVLEHVESPNQLVSEIFRVLKPGGRLLMTVPFAWQEHEAPFDFHRFSSFGIKSLMQKQGFEVKAFTKSTGSIEAIAQLICVYIICNWRLPFPGGSSLISFLFCFPVQIFAVFLQKILPDNKDIYLDNIIIAEKPHIKN